MKSTVCLDIRKHRDMELEKSYEFETIKSGIYNQGTRIVGRLGIARSRLRTDQLVRSLLQALTAASEYRLSSQRRLADSSARKSAVCALHGGQRDFSAGE
jgi:hypothetical protein